jgi:hypothetical protein
MSGCAPNVSLNNYIRNKNSPLIGVYRWSGFFFVRPPGLRKSGAASPRRRSRKGETVSDKTETTNVAKKAAGLGISLDAWAVALALGFALLVWLGWIKRVPW